MNATDAAVAGVAVTLLTAVALYVWTALALAGVFRKSGVETWKAWVPVLNTWTVLTLGGQAGWWSVVALVPVVNIVAVVMLLMAIDVINRRFGRGSALTVLAFFFYPVWASILAWGPARPSGPLPLAARMGPVPSAAPAAVAPAPLARAVEISPLGAGIAPPPPAAPVVPPAPAAGSPFAPAPASAPPAFPPAAPAFGTPAFGAPAFPAPASAPAPAPTPPAPAPVDAWAPPLSAVPSAPGGLDEADERTVIARGRRGADRLVLPTGEEIELAADTVVLGRAPRALPDTPHAQVVAVADTTKTVSKSHAVLRRDGEGWTIEDLHSTNGVVLVDAAGQETELTGRAPLVERFLLGDAEFRLSVAR